MGGTTVSRDPAIFADTATCLRDLLLITKRSTVYLNREYKAIVYKPLSDIS